MMQLNIICEDFLFRSGRALLLPEGAGHVNYPTDFMARMQLARHREYVVENGSVQINDDIDAGMFRLWLGDLNISPVTRPETTVNIPFFIHDLEIAARDITSGTVEVRLAPEGLYRITLRSLSGELLASQPLTFHLDLFSITVNSSEDGSLVCLGSPFHFFIDVVNFSMTITPEPRP